MKMKYLIFKRINKNLSKSNHLSKWLELWERNIPTKSKLKKSYKTQSLDNPLHLKGKIKKNHLKKRKKNYNNLD
jgi:hypothetical protein